MKPGRAGLVYGGANQPITDLVLVANGVGVVPMIQMVNELLPSSSSSVASACGERRGVSRIGLKNCVCGGGGGSGAGLACSGMNKRKDG